MEATQIKYNDAVKELEEMVERFEQAEVGVDELVGQVQRAGILIKSCRRQLRTVEEEVKGAIADLDAEPEPVAPSTINVAPPPPTRATRPRAAKAPATPTPSDEDDPFADTLIEPTPTRADEHPGGLFGI